MKQDTSSSFCTAHEAFVLRRMFRCPGSEGERRKNRRKCREDFWPDKSEYINKKKTKTKKGFLKFDVFWCWNVFGRFILDTQKSIPSFYYYAKQFHKLQ